MLDRLDATAVRAWCAVGLDALRRHQREIDDLNVFPVPDGDTGTNLVLTVGSAHRALERQPELIVLGGVLRCMARGALLGARGNSGVILSQLLRGIADALAAAREARGRQFAAALATAAEAGYAAVAVPVEGTVLTVARAAAHAAGASDSDELAAVVAAAAHGAATALARTPEQLPALARAGVVDAGGRGLCVFLDALVEVITGAVPPTAPLARVADDPDLLISVREAGSAEFAYEVQYLLDAPDDAVDELRDRLKPLGDSLVVVGAGDGTWNVHVHVNDVGSAIEAGVEAGRPYRIRVTRFADEPPPFDAGARAVVVIAAGDGLADLLAAEGARVVRGRAPATGEVLTAIRDTGAGRVVVLPNHRDAQAAADAAADEARAEGREVRVVPTKSPVQALAALAVRDPSRRFDDDVIAMAEAAGACRYGHVTVAGRDALTVAGPCRAGDVLGLVEGEVTVIAPDPVTAARELLDRMLTGGGELVTLVYGADAPAELRSTVAAHVAERWPFVEVQTYAGGQPRSALLVGVE